ncbi:DJC76 [Symbiodinium natans]|uniref:DJC76 protein n=1 Tax=Symbiodinium natans TaxID=878477 RepID=A0A812QJH7_9DINO|nr:DJC76 [Symbiodinium natans]
MALAGWAPTRAGAPAGAARPAGPWRAPPMGPRARPNLAQGLSRGTALVLTAAALIQRRRCALRAGSEVAPTDYYGLLGIPAYTSDKKEIKAAHRRTVKLVHPDILGAASGDLQAIVNVAYRTLSDDEKRETYDTTLRRSKMAGIAMSQWNKKGPEGLFVDETVCSSCLKCATQCPGTFEVDPRTMKPHVYMQYGSDQGDLDIAVYGCPEQAISKVPRKLVPLLEYAMGKSRSLQGRLNPFQLLAAAHCRVVVLTNPQELGALPPDAALREEYDGMMTSLKEDFRSVRDKVLDKYLSCDEDAKREAADKISKSGRPSAQVNDEDDERGVFVDESICSRCYKCVEVASSTFAVHRSPERGEKAHAVMQDADAAEILEAAVLRTLQVLSR